MVTSFAVMYGGLTIVVEDLTAVDRGVDDPMVTTVHPTLNCAFQVGNGIFEDVSPIASNVDIDTFKSIFTRVEGFEKLFH